MGEIKKPKKKQYWVAYNSDKTIIRTGVTGVKEVTTTGLILKYFDKKSDRDNKLNTLKA